MRRVILMISIVTTLVLGGASTALASATLAPSKVQLTLAPGEVTTFTVTFKNGVGNVLALSAVAWDFARDANGEPQPITASEAAAFRGCAAWLDLPASLSAVPSGSSGVVPVVVSVPADAVPGSHFTYLSVVGSPTGAKTSSVGYNFNALIVVTVLQAGGSVGSAAAPTLDRSVSIERLSAPTVMGGLVPLSAVLVNTGNVHADVKPRFEVLDGDRVVESIQLKGFTLLPGDRYPLSAEWSKPPLIGNYTARIVVEQVGGETLTEESRFWIVSLTALAIGACAILGLCALGVMVRKFVRIEIRRADTQSAAE